MAEKQGLKSKTLLDGKLHLFMRPGSSFWWTGFHHGGKYLRVSTKHSNHQAASKAATDWYFKKQAEIASGNLIVSQRTFAKVAEEALASYANAVARGERSAETLKGIRIVLNARVTPFFGKKAIESIGISDWFDFKTHVYSINPGCKRGTMHQYKNALRVVLNHAYRKGWIKQLPVIKDEYQGKRIEAPRPWFPPKDYRKLLTALKKHAKELKKIKPRWVSAAEELYDYVIFATNTGMRVGEMANTRLCDIEVRKELVADKATHEYLIIRNIKGKRGTGTCRSFYGAVAAYRRILARRGIENAHGSAEPLFLAHHRDMFNEVLKSAGLKTFNSQPPAKRDFVSLRATYICFRLLNGADVYEVANNCRTSVSMIEGSYARYLGGEILPGVNKIKGAVEGWDR